MPLMQTSLQWLIIITLLSVLLWTHYQKPLEEIQEEIKEKRKQNLHPKTPEYCPACVEDTRLPVINLKPSEPPPPWSSLKLRGGPKKTVDTHGQCCDNPDCQYFLERDASIHALVGSGVRGKTDDIQRLLCQACGNRFSARRDTALRFLKTAPERIEFALNLAAAGVDKAIIARALYHDEETVARWIERAGKQAKLLHEYYFHDLTIDYLQLDELQTKIRAYPRKKVWLWAAIDPTTKIVPVLTLSVGGRKTEDAMRFIHELVLRLHPSCVPLFTSDGLRQYFWALTAHFGHWILEPRKHALSWVVDARLLYGQLKKKRSRYKLKVIKTKVMCGDKRDFRNTLTDQGFTPTINTSYIERFNLTLRQLVSALKRRTWALAQTREALLNQLEWSRAYYHFVRFHSSLALGQEVPWAQRGRTPAMAAGLTNHRWRSLDILTMPLVAEGGG